MNDGLKKRILAKLEAMTDEIRWDAEYRAIDYHGSAAEAQKEADRLSAELVEFIDNHFVERSWMEEYWK